MIKLCHSIPVKSVENNKVAGSCLSEPLKEDQHQSPEEEQAAGGEDGVSNAGAKASSTASEDGDNTKEAGDGNTVPEETLETENKSSEAVSVSEQGGSGESVDSEKGSKKGEEDEKTMDEAAPDSTSALKESSSVEGDDQNKRFVAFCLLETKWLSLLHWPLCDYKKNWMLFQGKFSSGVVMIFLMPSTHLSHFTV